MSSCRAPMRQPTKGGYHYKIQLTGNTQSPTTANSAIHTAQTCANSAAEFCRLAQDLREHKIKLADAKAVYSEFETRCSTPVPKDAPGTGDPGAGAIVPHETTTALVSPHVAFTTALTDAITLRDRIEELSTRCKNALRACDERHHHHYA